MAPVRATTRLLSVVAGVTDPRSGRFREQDTGIRLAIRGSQIQFLGSHFQFLIVLHGGVALTAIGPIARVAELQFELP
jgi:hypothetical protein